MTSDEIKKLKEIIHAEVRPVREMVEIVKRQVKSIDMGQTLSSGQLRSIREMQSVMNDKLDQHTEVLESHTASLGNLEQMIPAIGDIHEMVEDFRKEQRSLEARVDNLEPRVHALEIVVSKRS